MLIQASDSNLTTPTGKLLLRNMSFQIQKGQLIHVLGPNGVGKSSLFKAIFEIEGLKISNLTKSSFSHFFLPQMENKEFLLPLSLGDLSHAKGLISNKKKGLEWNKASGGERKKALIDRALNHDCDLYILDEPFNHLDSESIAKLNESFEKLLKQGKSVILISHKAPKIEHIKMDVSKWS